MKMIVFKTPYEYCDFMCDSIKNKKGVELIEPIVLNKKNVIHIFLYVLFHINQKLFYKCLVRNSLSKSLSYEEKICFISFDSSEWTGTREFLTELKTKYPNSKTAIIIYNSIQNNFEKVKQYEERFDFCFTFDPFDSKTYGWYYFQGLMPLECEANKNNNKKYDICFIGNDKGRYKELKELYCYLTEAGFKCLFHITTNNLKKDTIDEEIIYEKGLPFKETLELEMKSKCILDVTSVSGKKQGISLRILEAIFCNSKVISNNEYTQDIPAIKKGTLFFSDKPEISSLRQFMEDKSRYIEISDLNIGFDSIFDVINTA